MFQVGANDLHEDIGAFINVFPIGHISLKIIILYMILLTGVAALKSFLYAHFIAEYFLL